MNCWRVDAGGQTLVLATWGGVPEAVYWGASLPASEDLAGLAAAARIDVTGGMLDAVPPLSLCPHREFQGQPGIVIAAADGTPLQPAFVFERAVADGGRLQLISCDGDLTLTHEVAAQATGVLLLQTRLTSGRAIRVHWLAAPVLPAPQTGDIIDVHGKWTREFHLNRVDWAQGARLRDVRTGRSGHEHPPYVIFADAGCTNTQGTAHALHYGWSGGHRMVAEELPDGRRQVQFGHAWGAEVAAGTAFETAGLIAAVSAAGLNGIGGAFQQDMRDRVVTWPDAGRARPVHYNCWEAVYFKHDLAELSEMADRAAAIGAERFVLDDGWFGRRDDDRSSLGDWVVDRQKWPEGLHPLIAHVHGLGMTFGLWFEPEMVNPDSNLARAHPDWVLGRGDQIPGRHQMVLNLGLAAVQDYLFAAISAVLTEYAIDYIKWDHNRLLPLVDAGQTRGVYALLGRLRAAHPGVEIESCASGGGRIDAGILAHTQRVWLSDSNDALERLRMQQDAALFLPAAITGSHVGPRHCHTSGRDLPMAFRAWVAAQRHMGFEMDLRELTQDEAAVLTEVTAWWKANRGWMMAGTIHRLDSADAAVTAEMQIAADGGRFVMFAGQAAASVQTLPRPLRLTGLDPAARYRVTLKNPEAAARHSRGPVALKSAALVLSGAALMQQGLMLPVAWPATMWVVEGLRL
ncbi:MAG: alpha-galactosidase [Paracoccaceae bacterium]